jgi:hypothetical protein
VIRGLNLSKATNRSTELTPKSRSTNQPFGIVIFTEQFSMRGGCATVDEKW